MGTNARGSHFDPLFVQICLCVNSFQKPGFDLIFLPRSPAMHVSRRSRLRDVSCFCSLVLIVLSIVLTCAQPAHALPAFARKYGLRCSACHESWPMLNYFGQKFKDNGYQLMNDRDAPIWQNPGYWPVTFRIVSMWHRVSTGKVLVDSSAGPDSAITRITTSGFDISGLEFHTGGTLEKNFSFYVL